MLNPIFEEIQKLENQIAELTALEISAADFDDVQTIGDCEEQIEHLESQIAALRHQWEQSEEDWVGTF